MDRQLDENLNPIYTKNLQLCKKCGKPFDKQDDFTWCPECLDKAGIKDKVNVIYG